MSTGPDFGAQIESAKDSGVDLLTDNVIYLFALPVLWVGYKVAKKVIGKLS